MSTLTTPVPAGLGIDPRGPRFVASLTSVVLVLVLLTPPPVAIVLLAFQATVFGIGAFRGIQHTPYAALFKTAVRPRLAPPSELEDARPPRFAQAIGLGFALVGVVAMLAGASVLGLVAVGLALVAALLNAVVGFCLGCEIYLLLRRATTR
jgi:hypothetical protein